MLTVRLAQIKILQEHAYLNFVERVTGHLRRIFQDRFETTLQSELLEWTRVCIARSRQQSVVTEREIVRLMDLWVIFGEDFEKSYPQAQQILGHAEVPESERVDRLYALFHDLPPGSE